MTIYALGDSKPQFPPQGEYWVAPNASVIGNVILHVNASVWFGAVLRGCMVIAYSRTAGWQLTWNPMWGVKDYTDELPQLCAATAPMKVKADFARSIAEINFGA